MKNSLVVMLAFVFMSASAFAESYTCSYPAYSGKSLVIIKVNIEGSKATIDKEQYTVLQNTNLGVVLVRSFAEYNKYTKADDLGLFGITINKKTMNFTRGNIIDSESHNSVAGSCVKEQK